MQTLTTLAVQAGRKRQSAQTGFVHSGETVPIVENILFSLALFRTRTVENIEEAKKILERLLHFQAEGGNFPIYLHDYPTCYDHYLGVHLLLPFYWIQTQFGHILGQNLRGRFEACLQRLHGYCYPLKELPPAIAMKRAALFKEPFSRDLFSQAPQQMAEALPALQLLAPEELVPLLQKQWHRKLLAYVGPAYSEWQEGSEPKATLYDLYMGLLSGAFSRRALTDQMMHLQAALIQPIGQSLPEVREGSYAYAAASPESADRSFHRFRLSFGGPEQLHTLVCQGGNVASCVFEGSTMICTLGPPSAEGEREKSRELAFYINVEAVEKILVGNTPATTFYLRDEVTLVTATLLLKLTFQLIEGHGNFMGHIQRGNRPAQLLRNDSYDWQIFLRTLQRSENCRIQVTLNIEEKSHVSPSGT